MKIFWSWQSDTRGKTGRHFVKRVLLEAIEELKQAEDVEEPTERDRKDAMHLDQDRQGVSGSPDLARTILEKIDASAVFVADVTPVSVIPAVVDEGEERPEKRNMNPNVAIELGYALKALSDAKILMLLNTHYGAREFLPFDLAHKAGPITYELAPDADKKAIEVEAAKLRGKFVVALRPYLALPAIAVAPVAATANERRTTVSTAAYYEPNESLAEIGEKHDHVTFGFPDGKGFYLRLIPRTPLAQPISKATLIGEIRRVGLYAPWRNPSGLFAANRYGAIVVEPVNHTGGPLKAATQLFPTGEIWGVAPWLLVSNAHGNFVPGQAFEQTFRGTLRRYVDFMSENLGIAPPYTVIAGAVGLERRNLIVDNSEIDPYGPFYDDEFQVRLVLNDASPVALDAALLRIFEALYEASGYPRPQGLFGFPAAA